MTRFPRIQSLVLHNPGRELVCKIRPEFFPHLKYLTVNSVRRAIVQWWTLLHNRVFSNGFPHLYKACLTSVSLPPAIETWTGSSSIRELEICWINQPRFLGTLLLSCPNLHKLKLIIDQFYSTTIFEYVNDGLFEVDENSIPHGIVIHRALRHLEIECVNSIDLFEFLESLLRCVPSLQQPQITICPFEGFRISCHNIARLLQNYVSSLSYFH
ncbi:unnamed protein product [Adineta steineri]|uniref:Uncharacterized protein n=1 Tax=Adineta steineri TaxID=433720 RepID=A0A819SG68_9BILA|nr:unnamed protein product [Adineta steineri]CAF4069810.1 unnamed protein product [Adineta steineri]